MLCTSVAEAIKRQELNFNNRNETYCLSSKTFHWFNSTEQVPLTQVETINEVNNSFCLVCRFLIVNFAAD